MLETLFDFNITFFYTAMCLEKRVFYRVISGLHTSINTHVCAEYLFEGWFLFFSFFLV